jgi:hypothetical protein
VSVSELGPVGAGVTAGSDHRDRDQTTVIKERGREPDRKVIIDREERESCGLRSELHLTPEMTRSMIPIGRVWYGARPAFEVAYGGTRHPLSRFW